MLLSVIFGVINGTLTEVTQAVTEYAKMAIDIIIAMAGILIFWMGLMCIAEKAGLIAKVARLFRPILRWLFPDVPENHPAMDAIVMNLSANLLGMANAATPFGLQAMQSLETLNPKPGVATNAMCMLLAINTSSIQLIPATAIAFLSAAGASHPTQIIVTALLATAVSTAVAIFLAKWLQRWRCFQG